MASAKDDHDQWQSPDVHAWKDEENEDEQDDDGHEFFDADEHPAPPTPEANLLHQRLNEQLNIEKPKIEDPYFIDEDLLKEREALLNDDEKEVNDVERSKTNERTFRRFRNVTANLRRAKTKETNCSVVENSIRLWPSTAKLCRFVR